VGILVELPVPEVERLLYPVNLRDHHADNEQCGKNRKGLNGTS
jgi:hypothetical protein